MKTIAIALVTLALAAGLAWAHEPDSLVGDYSEPTPTGYFLVVMLRTDGALEVILRLDGEIVDEGKCTPDFVNTCLTRGWYEYDFSHDGRSVG